jgi:hypothetical protein
MIIKGWGGINDGDSSPAVFPLELLQFPGPPHSAFASVRGQPPKSELKKYPRTHKIASNKFKKFQWENWLKIGN